jgi:hypothetical protein
MTIPRIARARAGELKRRMQHEANPALEDGITQRHAVGSQPLKLARAQRGNRAHTQTCRHQRANRREVMAFRADSEGLLVQLQGLFQEPPHHGRPPQGD